MRYIRHGRCYRRAVSETHYLFILVAIKFHGSTWSLSKYKRRVWNPQLPQIGHRARLTVCSICQHLIDLAIAGLFVKITVALGNRTSQYEWYFVASVVSRILYDHSHSHLSAQSHVPPACPKFKLSEDSKRVPAFPAPPPQNLATLAALMASDDNNKAGIRAAFAFLFLATPLVPTHWCSTAVHHDP